MHYRPPGRSAHQVGCESLFEVFTEAAPAMIRSSSMLPTLWPGRRLSSGRTVSASASRSCRRRWRGRRKTGRSGNCPAAGTLRPPAMKPPDDLHGRGAW